MFVINLILTIFSLLAICIIPNKDKYKFPKDSNPSFKDIIKYIFMILIDVMKSIIKIFQTPLKRYIYFYKNGRKQNNLSVVDYISITLIIFFIIILVIAFVAVAAERRLLSVQHIPYLTIVFLLGILLCYIIFIIFITPVEYIINYLSETKIDNFITPSIIIPLMIIFPILSIDIKINTYTYFIIIVLLFISYILFFKTLIICADNIAAFSTQNQKYMKYSKYLGIVSLFLTLVVNLFTHVLIISRISPHAYCSYSVIKGTTKPLYINNPFDLFYYTIVSLTTIGYGDIVPNNIISKCEGILIGLSSISFLIIFLGTVLSVNVKKRHSLTKYKLTE